jgi:hypothetical protein
VKQRIAAKLRNISFEEVMIWALLLMLASSLVLNFSLLHRLHA